MSSPKDKVDFIINPFTGELDGVLKFNPDRIITHSNNQAGNPLMIYDPVSGNYMEMQPLIVTDNNGNVVVI